MSERADNDRARRLRIRLVGLSFLMLFVELALIRWLGENIVFLSYFTNFVLLGSFLGIGLGFLTADRPSRFRWLPAALFALVAFALVFPVEISRAGSDVIFFGSLEVSGLPIWVMLPVVFMGAAGVLYLIAHAVARTFVEFPPLEAYRLDILGSVLGIVGFTALSWLRAPPVVWALVAAVLIVWLGADEVDGRGKILLAGLVIVLGAQSVSGHLWSPYYRVTWFERAGAVHVNVNGIPHQTVRTNEQRATAEPLYLEPYTFTGGRTIERVLIIGAGTGADVALALASGAEHVDAVEIDPVIFRLGTEVNPERPYDDDRVDVTIDDGRAFMQRSDGGYDLVLFALPDSLTLVAGQSSLRLESYLFTQEAIDEAVGLLADDGVFAMYNYYTEEWLVARLAATVAAATGEPPCVVAPNAQAGLAMIAGGPGVDIADCRSPVRDLTNAPDPVTDDWPFLYVRDRGLPSFYLIGMASILAATLVLVRRAGLRRGSVRGHLDLFLMGVAFLLLEAKSVVQFALWFGTTWVVNALVFTGVLLSVLGAVELARRIRLPRPAVLYGLLGAAVLTSWAVPPAILLELGSIPRLVVATVLTFSPIFLANLVFAQRFENTSHSAAAFGANLLGAMVGGALEYGALVIGYRSLALVVGVLYGLAFIAWRRIEAGAETGAGMVTDHTIRTGVPTQPA